MKYFSLLFLLVFSSTMCQALDDRWHLQRETNGINVSQQGTDSGYVITRGSIEIDASIDAIVSLMRDHPACARWLYSCKNSRLIKQYTDKTRLDYAVIDSPYFYADRDMYTFTKLTYDRKSGTALIRMSGRETHDKGQPGRVRIKDIQGFWQMRKINERKTAILYQVYSNPQLPPSQYLSNYLVDSVFQTLKNLAVVSKEAKYRNAQLTELH